MLSQQATALDLTYFVVCFIVVLNFVSLFIVEIFLFGTWAFFLFLTTFEVLLESRTNASVSR